MSDNFSKQKDLEEQVLYSKITYDSKERFCCYWHQINEVVLLNPKRVLEIGVGNGFVSRYLRGKGINIITLDINSLLKPNVVGSVLEIPFADKLFDVVACFETLEHLPYSNFAGALKEIYRVSDKYAILSFPDLTTCYRLHIELPRIKPIKKLIPHPFHRPAPLKTGGQHYWEIGKPGYPLKKIKYDIKQIRFRILKTYRVFEGHHRVFAVEKKSFT